MDGKPCFYYVFLCMDIVISTEKQHHVDKCNKKVILATLNLVVLKFEA